MPIFSLKLIIKEQGNALKDNASFAYHINENNKMQYRFQDLKNDQDSK